MQGSSPTGVHPYRVQGEGEGAGERWSGGKNTDAHAKRVTDFWKVLAQHNNESRNQRILAFRSAIGCTLNPKDIGLFVVVF